MGAPRDRQLVVHVSADEYELIERVAGLRGISMSAQVREAMGFAPEPRPPERPRQREPRLRLVQGTRKPSRR